MKKSYWRVMLIIGFLIPLTWQEGCKKPIDLLPTEKEQAVEKGYRKPIDVLPTEKEQAVEKGNVSSNKNIDYQKVLLNIAGRMEALKQNYPQMGDFSQSQNTDLEQLKIVYAFRTHPPQHKGGWTSGVPNPDDDGIWFHFDFHDPDSQAQIHTQPVVFESMSLGKKKVFLLILEGKNTKRLEGEIWKIAKDCIEEETRDKATKE